MKSEKQIEIKDNKPNYLLKMRILFVTNFYQLYGANRSLLSIMEKFKESGDEVCLLLPRKGDYSEELDKKSINYIVAPYPPTLLYFKKFSRISFYFLQAMLDITTLLVFPYILLRIWRFRADLIYSNSCADNLGILISKILRKKHITHVRDFMDLDHGSKFIFGKKAKRKYINMSDAVIYVSNAVATHTQLSNVLPPNHIVIYNGVKSIAGLCQGKKYRGI